MGKRLLFAAAQQALKALGEINKLSVGENAICLPAEIDGAMDALRAALAEPEPRNQCGETCERAKLCAVCARGLAEPVQEPYAWMAVGGTIWRRKTSEDDVPLYTAPPPQVLAPRMDAPQRKPLTDGKISWLWSDAHNDTTDRMAFQVFARAIEAAHGIKEKE